MNVANIKNFSKKYIRGKKGKIIGAAILMGLYAVIISVALGLIFAIIYPSGGKVWSYISIVVILSLLSPIFVGFYKYLIDLVRNEKTSVKVLLSYYTNCGNIILLAFIVNLFVNLNMIITTSPWNTILLILSCFVQILYLGYQYLLAINPKMDMGELIKTGFIKTKRNLWRIIKLTFAHYWVLLVGAVVYILIMYLTVDFKLLTYENIKYLQTLTTSQLMHSSVFVELAKSWTSIVFYTGSFIIFGVIFTFVVVPTYYFSLTKLFLLAFGHDKEIK